MLRFLRRTVVCFVGVGLAACSSDPTIEYQAYTGNAFPNRAAPIAWPKTGAALVTNSYGDSISVIDLALGQSFYTRPVGRNPVDLDGPHHVAVDATSRFAFTALSYPRIAASGPHAAHGSASIPGYVQKLSLDDLSIVGNVRIENNPGDIVISADGTKLVVSHFDLERATKNPTDLDAARASIAIVDPTKIAMVGSEKPTFVTVCVAPHGVALEPPPGTRVFVACYGEDSLAIVDLAHLDTPVERVPVTAGVSGFGSPSYGPYAATFAPDGKTLAVSDTESHDVRFFDAATKTFDDAATLTTLGAPYFTAWSADGGTLYVPTQQPDMLYAFPKSPAQPVSVTFDKATCQAPHLVTLVKDRLYVVCEGDHKGPGSLLVLDAATLATVSNSPLGTYPDAFALLPEGFQ